MKAGTRLTEAVIDDLGKRAEKLTAEELYTYSILMDSFYGEMIELFAGYQDTCIHLQKLREDYRAASAHVLGTPFVGGRVYSPKGDTLDLKTLAVPPQRSSSSTRRAASSSPATTPTTSMRSWKNYTTDPISANYKKTINP